jgi:hypothetical protein
MMGTKIRSFSPIPRDLPPLAAAAEQACLSHQASSTRFLAHLTPRVLSSECILGAP